ncbi:hypothetical protein ILUMI_09233 [Ignelater luminosus]|uniref:Plectin/eS10 N-terminal domain-containing protein n=1 Tax=Ignelater luminosus TaxID=2038154 RepID=A0A8K0GEQ4_IGNLU|nr:hypothetical protein ILUMI_09233 [Ignelater luminosus]
MLMPKQNKISIYEYLFKEGVMVAKKDFNAPKHPELELIPNVQVIKTLQSLKSRGYVREQFAWRHFYWYLTNEGIDYLRTYLHLPPEIVPSTLKRQIRDPAVRARPTGTVSGREFSRAAEDRMGYRKTESDKAGEVGVGSAQMEFRCGFGRGRPDGFH